MAADVEDRKKDYTKAAGMEDQLSELHGTVKKGYEAKRDQDKTIARCWDVYHCETDDDQQAYDGTSKVYVPLVKDAIDARVTRFSNTLFPQAGRFADVTSETGDIPYGLVGLLEHYVRKSNLRMLAPAIIKNGDVEGQYSVYVSWKKTERYVTRKVRKPQIEFAGAGLDGTEADDIETEKVVTQGPDVTVLAAPDLLVLPASVDSIDDAEVVAITLRLTKQGVRDRIADGTFRKREAKDLLAMWGSSKGDRPNPDKIASEAAGIDVKEGASTVDIWQVWARLKLSGDERRLCVVHMTADGTILGCKRNPYWNDRVPVISAPAVKEGGSFWGKSRVAGGVEQLQYAANDATNMGLDSAQYSLLPIVMTDPASNPRVGSMVMNMAAIWMTDPNSTKFVEFPAVWKDALSLVGAYRDQIMQALSVNPAMMSHGNAAKKPTQAQVAQEQQVAIEGAADVTSVVEHGVFSPLLEWFFELDAQFREDALIVQQFGELGVRATMETVEPLQMGERYLFRWWGVEASKTAQQIQQMIAAMNVLRGIPPDQLHGRQLDVAPIVEHLVMQVFGPRMAPRILVDMRERMMMAPEIENVMMGHAIPVEPSPLDDDVAHIQAHMQLAQTGGDPLGIVTTHIKQHQQQLQKKQAAAAPKPQGMPGAPGGAGPGIPGQGPQPPRIGAQPGAPRGMQNPPGAVHPDNMHLAMPQQ